MSAAEDWYQKGRTLRESGDIGGAIRSFNQALKEKPDFADACFDLARLLDAAKQTSAAIKMYEHWLRIVQSGAERQYVFSDEDTAKAVQSEIEKATAYFNRGEIDFAMSGYQRILERLPDMPTALLGVAACLHAGQRYSVAAEKLLAAIHACSGYAHALNLLGSCWRHMGRFAQAIAAYHQAIAADPYLPHVWANLARAYASAKQLDQTFITLEKIERYAPDDVEVLVELAHIFLHDYQWKTLAAVHKKLDSQVFQGQCEPFKGLVHIPPRRQLENAKKWVKKHWPYGVEYDPNRPVRAHGRLRIGYISSDFHTHATLALITELFEQHDRARFEIYAYSCGPDDKGAERARVQKAVDVFRDIRMHNDQESVAIIERDEIDILVDLKGHTLDNRLGIVARRPAPIAMHYIGYPGTTGAGFIDYFITDTVASPERAKDDFSENLIRLPMSYQINDRKRVLPVKMRTRAEHGLPEKGFVFCNFNASYKVTEEMFIVWMRVLAAVDGSVLWLYSEYEKIILLLRQEAMKYGIDPNRLIFSGHAKMEQHLERYLHTDMCLDTFPVCSHTTGSDALWCGVPLVTMAGEAFVSRVAASLLTAVGLPELITHNLAEYEAKALALARDPLRLAQLREHLESGRNTFSLFDSAATTRAIEAAYLHAAELHRNKKSPQSFTLTPTLEVV